MNMKKSIAGVMAGALAVSAIATTASAWTGGSGDQEQIVLSYDLNKEKEAWSDGSVVIKFSYAPKTDSAYMVHNLVKGGTTKVIIGATLTDFTNGTYTLETVNVTGTSMKQSDDSTNTASRTFSTDNKTGTDGKNEVIQLNAGTKSDVNGNVYAFEVPFTANGKNFDGFAMDGFEVNASSSRTYTLVETTPTPAVPETPFTDNYVLPDGTLTTTAPANAGSAGAFESEAVAKAALAVLKAQTGTVVTSESITKVEGYFTVKVSGSTGTSAAGTTTVDLQTYNDVTSANAALGVYQAAAVANATGQTYTIRENVTNVPGSGYGFKSYDITLTYTVNAQAWSGTWNVAKGNVVNVSDGIDNIADAAFSGNIVAPNHGNYYEPMITDWNAPAEIIARLTDLGYTYPQAVLNDVIANNENVAFTFTTAQKYVDNREYVKATKMVKDLGKNKYYATVENPIGGKTTVKGDKDLGIDGYQGYDLYGNACLYVKNPYYGVAYDANKDDDFNKKKDNLWYNPVFSQGLYQKFTWNGNNGYTASGPNGSQGSKDQFGSYASIWNTNLNSAGLVANSRWTMQLSDVDAFEWGDSTITFFWDAITDEANVTNAANFLQTLQLYTPSEWFWDKMDVAVGAAIAEDVAPDAPLEETPEEIVEEEESSEEIIEDEPEELPEEDPEEDFPEEDFPEEDFPEEEEFETEPEETEPEETEPVEEQPATIEVSSPKTGNAPVALAVIPVALAAAAVVAKKRK